MIRRRDVFALADDPSPDGRLRLLVALYVWGTGDAAFLVGRRARTFTRNDPAEIGRRLVAVANLMDADGPVAAYDSLLTAEPNHVRFMGPAFFIKYLYFAAGTAPTVDPVPLILDRVVARALSTQFGWSLPSTGWSAATYGRYLVFAAELAAAAGPGTPVAAIERAMFDFGNRG